jgi:hypothetical protein
MTGFDGADAAPVPIALVAVTVKVYEYPRPSTLTVVVGVLEVSPVQPPHAGEGITV